MFNIYIAFVGFALVVFAFSSWFGRFGPALSLSVVFYWAITILFRVLWIDPLSYNRYDSGLPGLFGGILVLLMGITLSSTAFRYRVRLH